MRSSFSFLLGQGLPVFKNRQENLCVLLQAVSVCGSDRYRFWLQVDFFRKNRKRDKMIQFIAGLFIGGFIGVLIMAIMNIAGKDDDN